MADASKRETRLQGQPTAGHSSPPDTVLELSDGTAAVPRKSSSSVIDETEQLPQYPPVWEAGGLTAGLFLALFCTSLVSCNFMQTRGAFLRIMGSYPGSNCSCHGYAAHRGPIPISGRYWLV